jgi:hypothetical protein
VEVVKVKMLTRGHVYNGMLLLINQIVRMSETAAPFYVAGGAGRLMEPNAEIEARARAIERGFLRGYQTAAFWPGAEPVKRW